MNRGNMHDCDQSSSSSVNSDDAYLHQKMTFEDASFRIRLTKVPYSSYSSDSGAKFKFFNDNEEPKQISFLS